MSRGLGWTQVELVIALATRPRRTGDLAKVISGYTNSTEPHYMRQCGFAARRALRSLERRRLVASEIRGDGVRWWCLTATGRNMAEPLVSKRTEHGSTPDPVGGV
jgi:hypothetical protein